jgi:hypothetical protein
MAFDPTRASFAQRDYSYAELSDSLVQTRQPLARTIELTTNASTAATNALATELLADNSGLPRIFSFQVDGVSACDPTQFAGSPLRYTQDFEGYTPTGGLTGRVIDVTIDYNSMTTEIVTKGAI